ncbi:MAG: 3'(2'),5'-bisphosphate nucleotidase CysQ [Reyranellaceae bacterium]
MSSGTAVPTAFASPAHAVDAADRLLTRQTLDAVTEIAQEAGRAIMEVYAERIHVTHKDDKSPVTAADHAAEAIILRGLHALDPVFPVIAEEEMAAGRQPNTEKGVFWLVDPLDGTKEFIKKNGEFTVNIALVVKDRPLLGVVGAPAFDRLWRGLRGPDGAIAEEISGGAKRPIAVRQIPPAGRTIFASRSHASWKNHDLEDFLEQFAIAERKEAGSSLKFCLIASGEADLYPRFGPTMEWDTAAGQAVLEAAGGTVTTAEGAPFLYGKPGFRNPHFVAWGGK